MRIAVCDDEAAQRELVQKLLTKWARQQNIELTVLLFPNAESFAYTWEEDKAFDFKKQLYISVTNSMSGRAKRKGSIFQSDKEGNHGFGLVRIDSIVAKYQGYINRQTENGVFATEVMLPLTK